MVMEIGLVVVVVVHDGMVMVDILDHKEDMDLAEDIPVVDSQDNAVDILLYKVIVDAVEEVADLVVEEVVDRDLVEMKVSSELDLLIRLIKHF